MNYEKSSNAVGTIDIAEIVMRNIEDSILIVDDSKFSRKILNDILQKEGFNVVAEAENGLEAIELTKEKKPKYIFLDVEMPVLDGLDALPKILEAYSSTNIIMCTAMGQQNILEKAVRAGAKDYVLKPYKKESIINIMNVMTANKDRQVIPFDRGRKNQDKTAETLNKNIVVYDLSPKDNFEACKEELLEFSESTDDEVKIMIEAFESEKSDENLPINKEENNDCLVLKQNIIKVKEIVGEDVSEEGLEAPIEQFIDFLELDEELDIDEAREETVKEEIRKESEEVEETIREEINQAKVIQEEIEEEALIKEESIKEESIKEEVVDEEIIKEEIIKEEIIKEEIIKEEIIKEEIVDEEIVEEEIVKEEVIQEETLQKESRKTYELQKDKIDEDVMKDKVISEETTQDDSQIALWTKKEKKTEEIIKAETYEEEEQKQVEILKLPETQEKKNEIDAVKKDEVQEETSKVHETTEEIAEPNNARSNSGINRFDYLWENRFEYRQREEIIPVYTQHRIFFHSTINSSNGRNNLLALKRRNKEIMLGLISAYLCASNRLHPENNYSDKPQNADQEGVRVFTDSILPGKCKVKTVITMTDELNLAAKKKQHDANNLSNAIIHLVQSKVDRILG